MRIVSIGDLVTDFYYKNGKLLGVNGGMTSHNIIANLAFLGQNTKVIGAVGNDDAGNIAIKSLKDIGTDISDINIVDNVRTRCFHVSYEIRDNTLNFSSKKRCPFCNNKKWYESSLMVAEEVLNKIAKTDILVFDNLNTTNQKIIDNTKNKKVIDLGQYFEFENLSNEEIKLKINNKFEIINFNERVSNYLLKRFNFENEEELYKLTKAKLITITKGKKGATFILNGTSYNFKLEKIIKEIDPTGAGDAFISSIINDWLINNLLIEENKLNTWYKNSTNLTNKVVKKMGARGHINSLYKIKNNSSNCTCDNFDVVNRKQIKRCNINVNNLETRLINAINSSAISKMSNINFSEDENYLFVGTGGSFAAAKFASLIVNSFLGSNAYAIFPRDIKYRNNDKIDKIFMFSYSGTTNDLIEATKLFDNSKKFIFTKGEQQKIVLKTGIKKENIISYRTGSNKGKERGFLSFEGAVAPAAIFMKYFYNDLDVSIFIHNSIEYWNEYFKKEFEKDSIKKIFKENNLLNIFTGDSTLCAGIDFESKVVESGIYNCIVHEKKNFSHGRFINYENLDNKNNIYFKQEKQDKYETLLLDYIKNDNNLIIESKYNGILCEFDLLIASQLLICYIGKMLDKDVSKPKYSEKAMKIYFYKGEI